MAQTRFWNWKDDDLTARLNSWKLGIIESGLYRGFDIQASTGNTLTLVQSISGYEKTDSNGDLNTVGLFITRQGAVITEDEAIVLTIPANTFSVAKQYLIVADHSYVEVEGGVECVYSVVEGGSDGSLPSLTNPNTDTILGVLTMPPNTSAVSAGTYIKSATPDYSGVTDRYVRVDAPKILADLDASLQKIVNLADPTADNDAVNRKYLQEYVTTNATPSATTTVQGKVELATQAEANSNTADKAITAATLHGRQASTVLSGLVRLATNAEALAGLSTVLGVTPASLLNYLTTGHFVTDANYVHTDNNLTDALIDVINNTRVANDLSYSNGDLTLKDNTGADIDSEFLPILKTVTSSTLSSGRQYLTFKSNSGATIDEIAISANADILFQCVLRDINNETGNIGANIEEGYGIDVNGDINRALTVLYGHNVASAAIVETGSSRTQIQINLSTAHTEQIYEISVSPMYWNATGTSITDLADLSEIANRIARIVWATAKIEPSYCRINFSDLSSERQGAAYLITGRRLKTHTS